MVTLADILRGRLAFHVILKWDPNQPRNPAGSGRESGRWAKGRALADIAPEYRKFPSAARSGGNTSIPPGMRRKPEWGGGVPIEVGTGNQRRMVEEARYASIMNAPMGTGFVNPPRLTGDPEMVKRLTPVPPPSDSELTLKALREANIHDGEELDPGSHANTAYHVTLDDANSTESVFKPEVGEAWTGSFTNRDINRLITNRDFSLGEREATAFDVSEAITPGLVPETAHRESLNIDVLPEMEPDNSSPDTDYQRELYSEYRNKAQEKAYDVVGDQMHELYSQAQDEHAKDIENRAEEMADIWNNLVDEYPEGVTPGSLREALRGHPVLPMGSKQPFERKAPVEGALDPLKVLDEADVDVAAAMTSDEEKRVEQVLRKHLEEGYHELGDVDTDAAREHLDRDKWMEEHQDTENRLFGSQIQSFTSWQQSQGFTSGGGGGVKNDEAPHPKGGSLQKFVEGLHDYGDLSDKQLHQLAVLDYVIGSLDRHGHNLQFDGNDQPVAIDNGYAFPAIGGDDPDGFTFRTTRVKDWLRSGSTNVPESTRTEISNRIEKTDWQALLARHPSMNKKERDALLGRVEKVKNALKTGSGLGLLWQRQDLMGNW